MKLLRNRDYLGNWIIALSFIFFIIFPSISAASDYWPTKGWRMSTPEEQGMDSNILADMMANIKKFDYDIDSVTIIRNGYMVADIYGYPFAKNQKHIIHSCTKSVMSALIGIAIDKGYIKSVHQPVLEFFPDKTFSNTNELKKSMTLENLLMMASGLECEDSYLYSWSGFREMIKSNEWAQNILDLSMVEPPGDKFEYCNGVSYLLSAIIQQTTNMRTLDFAREHLFGPLGITDIGWKTNPQGVDIGWGNMRLKPHDMAKIGWLYLNNGRWSDKQIVPSAWVESSTRKHIDATLFDHYGYQWWIDSAGYYMAVGFGGQFIFVIPDKNLVAVFTSELPKSDFFIPKKLLDRFIIPAAASLTPIPTNPKGHARLEKITADFAKKPAQGHIWTTEKEGLAKEGVFKRTALPPFQFEYPLGSKKRRTRYPDQILRMKNNGYITFSAFVGDVPENLKLVDFGPNYYATNLEKIRDKRSSNFQ